MLGDGSLNRTNPTNSKNPTNSNGSRVTSKDRTCGKPAFCVDEEEETKVREVNIANNNLL